MIPGGPKKRRVGSSGRLSSFVNIDSSKSSDGTLTESSQKPLGVHGLNTHSSSGFNNPSTADVILRLYLESSQFDANRKPLSSSVDQDDVQLHLHFNVLRRSRYFAALLSDRWQKSSNYAEDSKNSDRVYCLNLKVSSTIGSFDSHLTVLQLLYTNNFSSAIDNASVTLSILPVALELLFEDCVKACVRFLEAVPWSEEEETRVLAFVPLLKQEESRELLARVSQSATDCSLVVVAKNQTHSATDVEDLDCLNNDGYFYLRAEVLTMFVQCFYPMA